MKSEFRIMALYAVDLVLEFVRLIAKKSKKRI